MNHRLDRIGFAILSVGCLAIAVICAWAVGRPHIPQAMTIGLAVVFAVVGVLCGYRAFGPERWFIEQDRKFQEWCSRHPLLSTILVIFGLVSFVWQIIREIVRHVSL